MSKFNKILIDAIVGVLDIIEFGSNSKVSHEMSNLIKIIKLIKHKAT